MSQRQISNYVPEWSEDNDPDLWPVGWEVGPSTRRSPDVAPEYASSPTSCRTTSAPRRAPPRSGRSTRPGPPTRQPARSSRWSVADPDNLLHRNGRPLSFNPGTESGMGLLLRCCGEPGRQGPAG